MQTFTRPAGDILKLDHATVGWVLDLLDDVLDAITAEAMEGTPDWKDEDSAVAGEWRGLTSGVAYFGNKLNSVERSLSLLNVLRAVGIDPALAMGGDPDSLPPVTFNISFTDKDPEGTVEGDVIEAEFRAAEDALERADQDLGS